MLTHHIISYLNHVSFILWDNIKTIILTRYKISRYYKITIRCNIFQFAFIQSDWVRQARAPHRISRIQQHCTFSGPFNKISKLWGSTQMHKVMQIRHTYFLLMFISKIKKKCVHRDFNSDMVLGALTGWSTFVPTETPDSCSWLTEVETDMLCFDCSSTSAFGMLSVPRYFLLTMIVKKDFWIAFLSSRTSLFTPFCGNSTDCYLCKSQGISTFLKYSNQPTWADHVSLICILMLDVNINWSSWHASAWFYA